MLEHDIEKDDFWLQSIFSHFQHLIPRKDFLILVKKLFSFISSQDMNQFLSNWLNQAYFAENKPFKIIYSIVHACRFRFQDIPQQFIQDLYAVSNKAFSAKSITIHLNSGMKLLKNWKIIDSNCFNEKFLILLDYVDQSSQKKMSYINHFKYFLKNQIFPPELIPRLFLIIENFKLPTNNLNKLKKFFQTMYAILNNYEVDFEHINIILNKIPNIKTLNSRVINYAIYLLCLCYFKIDSVEILDIFQYFIDNNDKVALDSFELLDNFLKKHPEIKFN
jgi:hypothetical protein